MKTSNAIPGFSALRMKEEIQRKRYEETLGMTREERDAYRKKQLENSDLWKEFTQRNKSATVVPKRAATCKKKELA
ncbi:MAG: hypothetical protein FWD02_01085 [Bacteroidales bacterium]|nr:hypothetical protein [Bacteroidales bacterium]